MAVINGRIKCSHCRKDKPLSKFTPAYARNGYGLCRPCAAEAARERTKKRRDPDQNPNYQADFVADQKKKRAAFLRDFYGISDAEYTAMLDKQGGGCAICGKHEERKGYRLAVDHCHESGRVRGILCTNCNRGIGLFRDSTDLIERAIKYLS